MKLTAYFLFAYDSLKENLTYWKNAIAHFLGSFFVIAIQLFAWTSLYQSVDYNPVMGRTFETMLTYMLVVALVSEFTNPMDVSTSLEERLKSGEIAMDFLRPVAPRGILIARSWGGKALHLFSAFFAVGITIALVGGIQPPAASPGFAFFLLSLLLGYIINLLFNLLMGTFAFWFVAVGILSWFIDFFQIAMSGAIIPLWLLPDWLQTIARMLPFQAIIYVPMQIYLGGISMEEVLLALGMQLFWIVFLYIAQELMWRRGIRRIVVHGG